ncbi:MAG: Hsp33 family molecular chaperone HslO, partial [Myxococcales bacterium]|nr:Hsp33 family molecular chaperone HslO [Myxococcales bacterium]
EAARRHALRGAAAVMLGRGLTAGCLLATLTKGEAERVRIELRGDGLLGRMLVDAHGDGRVRGCYTSERAQRSQLPVAPGRPPLVALVGAGLLAVTRDLGLETTYQGVVELRTSELDEDLERYLSESEQLPSVLRCHVMVDAAGDVIRAAGVLAQTFPGAGPSRLDPIRRVVDGSGLADVLLQERTPEALMGFALKGHEHHALEATALRFECDCGRDRARSVVSTLGPEDIEALADEQGGTEVRCTYCGDAYSLSEQDLRGLAAELREQLS